MSLDVKSPAALGYNGRMENAEIIIIGGGAAGLAAAIAAARHGKHVVVLEANDRIGKKILVSGNGKCNISNRHIHLSRFHSTNPLFIADALGEETPVMVEAFFASIGLALVEGKEGQMFPMSLQASSVIELLRHETERLNVQILTECAVTRIEKKGNMFELETTKGAMKSPKLLLATGSPAAPQLGGSEAGYAFAIRMGHTLISPVPVLVQLRSEANWPKRCAGVKTNGMVKLYANGTYITEKCGDLLFTNYGISGLAILDISREVSRRLSEYEACDLQLDLFPDLPKAKLTNLFLSRIQPKRNLPIKLWLHGILNQKLISVILEQSHCQATHEENLNRKAINKLVHALKNLRLPITGTREWEGAEVAAGGIDTQEINPDTMESKIIPGLYFAGEILDVDGDRGGFNFHWAWVSGIKAGKN
jgi:predicted Rossmann fold flavoprotein